MEVTEQISQDSVGIVAFFQPLWIQKADGLFYGTDIYLKAHVPEGQYKAMIIRPVLAPDWATGAALVEEQWLTVESYTGLADLEAFLLEIRRVEGPSYARPNGRGEHSCFHELVESCPGEAELARHFRYGAYGHTVGICGRVHVVFSVI
jgi:hypothetical protein